jgi:hypothetical protein
VPSTKLTVEAVAETGLRGVQHAVVEPAVDGLQVPAVDGAAVPAVDTGIFQPAVGRVEAVMHDST